MKTQISLIITIAIFFIACNKKDSPQPENTSNNSNPTPQSITVGSSYQGGVIAYIFQPGDQGYVSTATHGFIVTQNNIGTSLKWYNGVFNATGSSDTLIGSGQANTTTTIISSQGNGNYVATVCDTLTLNGYTDWYLPSKHELNKLYANRIAIGGFTNGYYWSSSETTLNSTTRVWVQNLNTGLQYDGYKDINFYYIRAIRSF